MEHDRDQGPTVPAEGEWVEKGGRRLQRRGATFFDEEGKIAGAVPGVPRPRGKGKKRGKARAPSTPRDKFAVLRQECVGALSEGALLLSTVSPTSAEVAAAGAEQAADNMVTLARRYPWVAEALEKSGTVFAVIGLASYAGAIAYGAAVDFGRADPRTMVAERMGIGEAFRRTHEEEEGDEPSGPTGDGGIRPPAFLEPVQPGPA